MPTCCRCNGSGRCVSCTCVKSGKPCIDCLPSRKGCCRNLITTTEPTVHTPLDMAPLLTVEPTQAEATQSAYLTPSETTHTPVIPNDAHFPPYPQVCSPCFKWGDCEGPMFQEAIKKAYNQVVHWYCNIFKISSGKGKMVVKELTRLFESYADATTLESVAITAAMVLPSLILQKLHRSSKTKEHVTCIKKRMKLWQEGNLVDLLKGKQSNNSCNTLYKTKDLRNNWPDLFPN